MEKLVYICRCCGEPKAAEAFKTWTFGVMGSKENRGRALYCNECRAKKQKEKKGNES